jgi:FkbM family methyltransferase
VKIQSIRSKASQLLYLLGVRRHPITSTGWKLLEAKISQPPILDIHEFDGHFHVSVTSDLFKRIVSRGYYEPELASLIKQHVKAGSDAIDIGANVGFFSCLMSKCVGSGRVLACEPTTVGLNLLKKNLLLNHCANVTIFEGAVSNQAGAVQIAYIPGREEYSSLGAIVHPSATGENHLTMSVPSLSLDELVVQHSLRPSFIKMDVEGAEFLVLDGSHKTLETYRPLILAELSDLLLKSKGSSLSQVSELLQRFQYDIRDPLSGEIVADLSRVTEILATPRSS